MTALKTHMLALAELLGVTQAVLYERQRTLVQAGLLKPEKGHGPGSGVKATPETVAIILIAATATDNLADTPQRTKEIIHTKPKKGECAFTGKRTFLDALTFVLTSEKDFNKIVISRTAPTACLWFKFPTPTVFVGRGEKHEGIQVDSTIDRELLQNIKTHIIAEIH